MIVLSEREAPTLGDGKVLCEKCDERVVPRLLHSNEDDWMFFRSTQHICPLCGVTMYRTGGGITIIGRAFFALFGFIVLAGIVDKATRSPAFAQLIAYVVVAVGVVWYLKRRGLISKFLKAAVSLLGLGAK